MALLFKDSDSDLVKKKMVLALANCAEVALFVETPTQILGRIKQVEEQTDDEQNLILMKLLRLLLADIEFSQMQEAIQTLSSDIELTWGFSEIKDYINDNFDGLKRQQIDAVIDFFENHKDKQQFIEAVENLKD
jgi:hypothetical protein